MTFKESNLVILITAALIATVVRMFFYLSGGHDGLYLRESITNMGVTVVVLEVCIVMLRFFTTFSIMNKFNKTLPKRYELIFFTVTGMIITFAWTSIPKLFETPPLRNDALIYINNRPFEPIPIIVEYVSLYLIHHKIVTKNQSLSFLCFAVIGVIIAISDVKGNGNTTLPIHQN